MPSVAQSTTHAKVSETLKRLDAQLDALQDSENFKAYLKAQAAFHHYSFGNAMSIMFQRPDATRVAGFKTWLKLNRYVKKGEKGICILVPMFRKSIAIDKATGEEVSAPVPFFGTGHVFDISQTDGEELPDLAYTELTGDDDHGLYARLVQFAHSEGVTVRTAAIGELAEGVGGHYEYDNKAIVVVQASGVAMTRVLVHELGHHLTGHASGTRAEREAMAESIAFVVSNHFGIDTSGASLPYLAGWSADKKLLKAALATIQKAAATLIDAVESIESANEDVAA